MSCRPQPSDANQFSVLLLCMVDCRALAAVGLEVHKESFYLCLNCGGLSGSSTTSVILMMHCWRAPPNCQLGVYRINDVFPWLLGTFLGWAAFIFPLVIFSRAAQVLSAVACTSSSEGHSIERSSLSISISFLYTNGMRSLNQDWTSLQLDS
jgi:hypothetical protein